MAMSKWDMMRLFEQYEELSEGDFSPEELEEYFAYASGTDAPLSPAEWKAQYFDFYDDVKDNSLKKQDW